jgi:hypothetical protein
MYKKLILVLAVVVLFLSSHIAYASLVINEIMYDLSGSDSASSKSREWIEIYNSDASEVVIDASKWRIYDGSANRTINGEDNFSIPANSYVILAGDKDTFLADHAGFSGTVYDTGITSLNNTGDTLKILDQDLNSVDFVTYASTQGGAGDGNSLQKISSSWAGATPTPGVANESGGSTPSSTTSSSTTSSSGGGGSTSTTTLVTGETKIKTPVEQKIRTEIIGKTLGFVNLPLTLEGKAYGHQGEKLYAGKYFWNFGDGDAKEITSANNQPFSHTYFYPGDYIISLDYYANYYALTPEAVSQITVKIIPVDISISRVGDAQDFFVELSNNTDYNADISDWSLVGQSKVFTLPKNTILSPKKKMIISPRITGFSIADKNTLQLINSEREVVFNYSTTVTPVFAKQNTAPKALSGAKTSTKEVQSVAGVPNENLLATALSSDIPKEETPNSSPLIPIASLVFIGASAGAVYFIRQKKVTPQAGGDFEILDE